MSIQITDNGQTIKIVNGSKIDYVNKGNMNITVNGDYVFIEEGDGEQHNILFTDVTVPVVGDVETLASTLVGYIENTSDASVSSSNTPSLASSATAASANTSRKSITIQNQSVNTLYVRYGASASTTVYHVALNGCTVANDGLGGSVYNDEYTGIVTIAGTSPSYTVLEL